MTTFALVHGAWHGAWCWERLTPELEKRGHRVVAVDLCFDDATATFDDHADTIAAAIEDDAVVVGHSLGGYLLPFVAARRQVRRLIYLSGVIAVPGRTFAEQDREQRILNPIYVTGLEKVGGATRWVDFGLARSLFYSDCDDEVAATALPRLRPQATALVRERCALESRPAVPTTSIVCTDDQMVDPRWSRGIGAELLGVTPVEFPSGHSPFYSCPAAFADLLDRLA